jgi:SAM-dependent methyltransferase
MVNDTYIKNHYKRIAESYGENGLSTIKDQVIRDAEMIFFLDQIKDILNQSKNENPTLLDIGCGNGFLLKTISENFPSIKLTGLEFTPELFTIAQERKLPNCIVYNGDAREPFPFEEQFDVIVTERTIINLLSWKQQAMAFQNIYKHLRPGGFYLMSESFKESWTLMNMARKEFLLEEIPISKHNVYLSESGIKSMKKIGFEEIEGVHPSNYLSTHFYVTRVLHPAIRPDGAKVTHTQFAKFFNQALPTGIGNYSPIQFRVFQKPLS